MDCKNLSAAAFPGNPEVCDGVDNDCNEVVDDGMSYVASKTAPLRVSTLMNKRAQRGGFVGTGNGFALTYEANVEIPTGERPRSLIKSMTARGTPCSKGISRT